ncbi:MAG: hypothetical protein HOP29_15955 [Phycisphaerales bacterium]|nr:hypothetical protein [Phycisphaerales bacterium]
MPGCIGGGGSGRTNLDSDGDGFTDNEETNAVPGSDPMNPDDTPDNPIDTDGDGCSDYDESNFEGFCDGNPNTPTVDDPNASFQFELTTARHVNHDFTGEQLDAKLSAAGAVLQTMETECPDVATDVTFHRTGDLSTFDSVPAVITTERQLDAAFELPFDIKIVQAMVGVCGVFDPGGASIILGCAATGESLVIVSEADPDVWAHEWGHVQGLPHRDDCPRNVMHSFEVATNAVNDAERAAFLTPTPKVRVPRITTPPEWLGGAVEKAIPVNALPGVVDPLPGELARTSGESLDDWLGRIVRKRYLAGVPAAAFADADEQWAGKLSAMLDDAGTVGFRRNIVRAVGFCGQPEVCGRLVGLIQSAAGELTFDEFGCIAEAFLALGRLAPHDPTGTALAFLMDGADVARWNSAAPAWSFGAMHGDAAAGLMARMSIMSLGLTGDARAIQRLTALRETMKQVAATDADLVDQVDESIAGLSGPLPANSRARAHRRP